MSISPTLDINNKLPRAQDYRFLREEAISLIQSLSGDVWTDYNTHDPGITLLEAICYALTDLGYRTSFDMQDILAPQKPVSDNWEKIFYTARQVLPCNPLTLLDYRKLIIDTEGVRNAWIEVSDEYEVLTYVLKTKSTDPDEPKYRLTQDFREGEEVLRLRGLYKVFVEYENHVLKDNLEEKVADIVRKKLQFHRNLCEDFITVSSIEYKDFTIKTVIQVNEGTDIEMINARIYKVIHDFFSPPIRFYSLEQMLERDCSAEEIFEGPVLKYGFIDSRELEKSERYKDIHLSDIVRLISGIEGVIAVKEFVFGESKYAGFTEWINDIKDNQKVPRLDRQKSTVSFVRSGDRHRGGNNKADKERVEAIFSFLQSGFKSRLKGTSKDLPVPRGEFMNIADYYPFQNSLPVTYGMTERYIDDVVDRAAIMKAVFELLDQRMGVNLRRIIIRLLNETENKEAITSAIHELLMEDASESSALKKGITGLLTDKARQAQVSRLVSEIFGGEKQLPLPELITESLENKPGYVALSDKTRILEGLALGIFKKTLFEIDSDDDINRLKDAYKKYQIERLGERKQLTLQLRGFLMVFEQIMADHLSQLARTRELLSFDPSIDQTAFPQFLQGVQDMEALFIDYRKFSESAHKLMETEEGFVKTRNNILDHLMARFSESTEKYSFFMQQFLGKTAGKRLIADKIALLSDYVEISSYRGKGFNYTEPDVTWNTDNVEGVKKRICRLLGIGSYSRRTIAPPSIYIKKVRLEKETIDRYVVILADPDDKESVLLESIPYMHETEARQILDYIMEHGSESNLYRVEGKRDKWIYQLKKATPEKDKEVVASGREFLKKEERDLAFKRTLESLTNFSNDENFHVVEHILLRPRIDTRETDPDQLLIVRNVPDSVKISTDIKKEFPYRFHIKQGRNSEDITVWTLSLLKDDDEILVVKDEFTFFRHLTRRLKHIREFGADASNYHPDAKADGVAGFKLSLQDRYLAESRRGYRQKAEMDEEINELVNFFSYELAFMGGKDDEDDLSYYADPYSLQVSVVIPSWPRRFQSPAFKHLLEKTIYLETPSHIFPNIYWLDHHEMEKFETAYQVWVKEMAGMEEPDTDIIQAMISAINDLRRK